MEELCCWGYSALFPLGLNTIWFLSTRKLGQIFIHYEYWIATTISPHSQWKSRIFIEYLMSKFRNEWKIAANNWAG